jgi:hypothetical protein
MQEHTACVTQNAFHAPDTAKGNEMMQIPIVSKGSTTEYQHQGKTTIQKK